MTSIQLAEQIRYLLFEGRFAGINTRNYGKAIKLYNDYTGENLRNNSTGRRAIESFCENQLKIYINVPLSNYHIRQESVAPSKYYPTIYKV